MEQRDTDPKHICHLIVPYLVTDADANADSFVFARKQITGCIALPIRFIEPDCEPNHPPLRKSPQKIPKKKIEIPEEEIPDEEIPVPAEEEISEADIHEVKKPDNPFRFKWGVDLRNIDHKKLVDFVKSRPSFTIMTTRFTKDKPWQELLESCGGTITYYCSPVLISSVIQPESRCVVIEMDNTINRIMGLGLIINRPRPRKQGFSTLTYNRYTYRCERRIDREQLTQQEEQVMMLLDMYCFYGKSHLKRPQGITQFPRMCLYGSLHYQNIDIYSKISEMFNSRIVH